MKIGIIGIGSLTLELARRAVLSGYKVVVHNPKGNCLVRETIDKMGPQIELGNIVKAASTDILILFVPKADLEEVIGNLPDMTGKIVVHTSGLIFNPDSLLAGISCAMTYKITASLLPEANVVKLFKPLKLVTNTSTINAKREKIFYITDHQDTKLVIKNLLTKLHFSAINLPGNLHLSNAGYIDMATLNKVRS